MILSKDLIKEIAKEINTKAFNGALDLSRIQMGISQTKRNLAHVSVLRKRNFDTEYIATDLKVSKLFDWTLEELKNTIAHELIHIYEAQILKRKPGHGPAFKIQLIRLNSLGYNVVVKAKGNKVEKIPSTREVIFVLSEDKSKVIFTSLMCLIKIQKSESFQRRFGNCSMGKVSEGKIENKYALSRKYRGYHLTSPELLIELGA